MLRYILILVPLISGCSVWNIENQKVHEEIPSLRIFEAYNGFDILYDSGVTKTIKEYYTPGSIVLNGSYFGVTDSSMYYPAGLWIENRTQEYSLRTDDTNLSHAVFLSGDTLQILPNNQSQSGIIECLKSQSCRAFQSGPLVLSENLLQDFGDSWHANGKHERTLIGKTQSGKIYFFISTDKLSLHEIGEKILEQDIFKDDPINVINLDGGPSTAYYDGVHGFREEAKLPIIFRIKP